MWNLSQNSRNFLPVNWDPLSVMMEFGTPKRWMISVKNVEKTPEHDWVRHAGEVPFRVPMEVGGWQRVKGAQGRLVTCEGIRVPGDEDVTARGNPAHCGVDVGVVGRRGTT
jgi:hypothetical protein